MPRLCSVCTHPQHQQIDVALIEHTVPYQRIATAYGLSETALYHHRVYHLRARLEDATMLDAEVLSCPDE